MRSDESERGGNEPGGRQPANEAQPMERLEMERLEAALRNGLQRRAAPEGLEERILARAMAGRGSGATTRARALRPSGRMAGLLRFPIGARALTGRGWAIQRIAASVALGAVVAGAAAYYQTEQRRRSEAAQAEQTRALVARDQVMEALRITSRTLNRVQDRLNDEQ